MRKVTDTDIETKADEVEASTSWCDNMSFVEGAMWMRGQLTESKPSDGVLASRISCIDYTFATRLKSFVSDVQVNDQMGEEEKEYIIRIADKLREEQTENATEQWEKDYLERTEKPKINSVFMNSEIWTELEGEEYDKILTLSKQYVSISTSSSLHIYEEIFELNGIKYRFLYASDGDRETPTIERLEK